MKTLPVAAVFLVGILSLDSAVKAGESIVPAYVPVGDSSGEIRVWGSPADAGLLQEWERGFRKFHPAARVNATLHGPESAMMGVYTGVAELSLMAREMRQPAEYMAFTWALRYPPTVVEVANSATDTPRPNASLAVFVHASNPLAQLTIAQLDSIFGAEHKRGPANVRTWGQLGLAGAWKDKPIHALSPGIDHVSSLFFREVVLAGSSKWNTDLAEFSDEPAALAAAATDDSAIVYGPLHGAPAGLKALPLAAKDGEPFVALTRESAVARTYPLARVVTVVLNRAPGTPLAPDTKEFLRYVLSAEGQASVVREGSCLPLNAAGMQASLQKLE
jgi:phosphate transport system substrate-binding protein